MDLSVTDRHEKEQILFPLKDQVAVITGGSRGIGAAMCRLFARRGAHVVTTYRRHGEDVQKIVEEIESIGRQAIAVKTDVADRDTVMHLFDTAASRLGRVDIAVANAAINKQSPVADASWKKVSQTVDVTMYGVFHTLQAGARHMIRQKTGGKLLAISSIHANIPFPNSGAYNMSKAGINHLCRTMARELASHQITVNAIEPGWIDTEGERDRFTEEDFRQGAKRIPLGRLGRPEEIAKLALYIVSKDADYVTGSIFRIDGGMALVN